MAIEGFGDTVEKKDLIGESDYIDEDYIVETEYFLDILKKDLRRECDSNGHITKETVKEILLSSTPRFTGRKPLKVRYKDTILPEGLITEGIVKVKQIESFISIIINMEIRRIKYSENSSKWGTRKRRILEERGKEFNVLIDKALEWFEISTDQNVRLKSIISLEDRLNNICTRSEGTGVVRDIDFFDIIAFQNDLDKEIMDAYRTYRELALITLLSKTIYSYEFLEKEEDGYRIDRDYLDSLEPEEIDELASILQSELN